MLRGTRIIYFFGQTYDFHRGENLFLSLTCSDFKPYEYIVD